MRAEALEQIPLICPVCRRRDDSGALHLSTLSPDPAGLVCDNAECRRAFPIVDGVLLIVPDPAGYIEREALQLLDLPALAWQRLAEHADDQAPLGRLLEHLSIYLDAHWGDQANPPSSERAGATALWRKLGELPRVASAVELGASCGRGAAELAATADAVVALDIHAGALRHAARRARGLPFQYLRRHIGRHYRLVDVPARPAQPHALFVVGDALDPPLCPGAFARVCALNLLDSVRAPRKLLQVIDGLCAAGGELVLSAPYAWTSTIVLDEERFPGDDPAAWLRDKLGSGEGLSRPYDIIDEDELAWHLRRDDRSTTSYRTHYLRARKRD